LRGEKIYLFDSKKLELRSFAKQEGVNYAGNVADIASSWALLKKEVTIRKEFYETLDDTEMTMREFGLTLEPTFVVVDMIQDLVEKLTEAIEGAKDDTVVDLLIEASNYGVFIVIASDSKLRGKKSEFITTLLESKQGLVLGNLKDQGVYARPIRTEENNQADVGYFCAKGENIKLKLVEYRDY
jgi:hypothetical protein